MCPHSPQHSHLLYDGMGSPNGAESPHCIEMDLPITNLRLQNKSFTCTRVQQLSAYNAPQDATAISHPGSPFLSTGIQRISDSTMTNWQAMRKFHSHTASQLFPHGHQLTTGMPEELVLMWTILQPTLDMMPWRHTYVWNDQLDGLVQAMDNSNFQSTYWQFSKFFQGASISKAQWNAPSINCPFPKSQFITSHRTIQPAQVIPIPKPLNNLPVGRHREPQHPQPQTGNQQWETPQTPPSPGHKQEICRTTAAHSTSHNLKNKAHDWELKHPAATEKQYTFNTVSGDSPSGLLAALLILLSQNMEGSNFTADEPQLSSTNSRYWHHRSSFRNKLATPPKWCQRWVTAILQCFWDTAWDTLTHWNVENSATWAWPAHTIDLVLV